MCGCVGWLVYVWGVGWMVYVWVCRMVSVCVGVCDGWCMCGCVGWLVYIWGVGWMVYVWVCRMVSVYMGCRMDGVCLGV